MIEKERVKIKAVFDALEQFAPLPLQEDWDNAGLQTGLTETEASGALLCLDVNEKIVDEAIAKGCNVVVSHHPLIFRPLRQIVGRGDVQRTVAKAIKNDVAIISMHTNMDNARGGVNWQMAERMASIAHESLDDLGQMIFSASTSDDKSPDDILFQDYKEFMLSGHTLGVGQVVTLDSQRVLQRREEFLAAMRARKEERMYDMMLFMITDMLQEGSHLLFLGSPDVIAQAFNVRPEGHRAFLPGILSRKKQVIPALSVFWG